MRPAVLDAGALIAIERRARSADVMLEAARRVGARLIVPAGCLAQVWRSPRTQVQIARLVRLRDVVVVALDEDDARAIGRLLRRSGTADVVDAHVAVLAERFGASVVTSDPDDLRALDPTLDIVAI